MPKNFKARIWSKNKLIWIFLLIFHTNMDVKKQIMCC